MRSEKNPQNFQTYKAMLKCLHSIYSQEYQTFRDEKKIADQGQKNSK